MEDGCVVGLVLHLVALEDNPPFHFVEWAVDGPELWVLFKTELKKPGEMNGDAFCIGFFSNVRGFTDCAFIPNAFLSLTAQPVPFRLEGGFGARVRTHLLPADGTCSASVDREDEVRHAWTMRRIMFCFDRHGRCTTEQCLVAVDMAYVLRDRGNRARIDN